jgi:hypothetical protein
MVQKKTIKYMKKHLLFSALFILATIFSCNSSSKNTSQNKEKATDNSSQKQEFYFEFTIDGKAYSIPVEEVSTTYNDALKKPVFKIMAGEYGKINVLLATTESVTGPSSTPSGSENFDDEIKQGSVSLQNFPEKNYTSNSYNMGTPASMVITPNAITITKSTRYGDTHRVIEGTFNTKVYGGEAGTDKNVADRHLAGSFRLKHEFTSVKF